MLHLSILRVPVIEMSIFGAVAKVPGGVNFHPAESANPGGGWDQRWGRAIWVVVKIMVPFWVLNRIRHLLFRVPKKGP